MKIFTFFISLFFSLYSYPSSVEVCSYNVKIKEKREKNIVVSLISANSKSCKSYIKDGLIDVSKSSKDLLSTPTERVITIKRIFYSAMGSSGPVSFVKWSLN